MDNIESITNATGFTQNPDTGTALISVLKNLYDNNLTTQNETQNIAGTIIGTIIGQSKIANIVNQTGSDLNIKCNYI